MSIHGGELADPSCLEKFLAAHMEDEYMVHIWLIYGQYMVNIWLIYGQYIDYMANNISITAMAPAVYGN